MVQFQSGVPAKQDVPLECPPDDSTSCMEFSPIGIQQLFLVAGSWDNKVRLWEVDRSSGKTVPKSMESMDGPILDVCWIDDGSKVFMAGVDKTVKCWDLNSNQKVQIAQHDAAVKTCHYVKAPNYSCLMTTSFDKTIKFWDMRSPNPMMTIVTPERCYCADVDYPMAVVGTAGRHVLIYTLENSPTQHKQMESPLKYQTRCISIFKDNNTKQPTGYALGSVEGRVAIQYINATNPKDNFTFKCHRSNANNGPVDIYPVNDIKFHPIHGTLATVGSDGRYIFWDKNARRRLKQSAENPMETPITCCAINPDGQIFAYARSYDWSKGHEYNNLNKVNEILLHECMGEMDVKYKGN